MADMTGATLGKYQLVERLGRGGMAEVYRAYQLGLDRHVAVKVMHGYLADDEQFVSRFRREAKAVAALHHPHIVQVFDFDTQDDVYYMVMEYITGETLKARLRELAESGERLPLDEVVRIFCALCDALDYAHARGCVHRDIKPANIMFDERRLVLTDFGIATIVGGTRYTASGALVGTPAYMSPEQGQGEPGSVQSDVYSLGVILYEMVTGRLPYDADTPLAIVLKHLNEPLPIPSRVCADVAPAVERVVLKALAKSPGDRYSSAGALASDLELAKTAPAVEPAAAAAPPLAAVAPSPSPLAETIPPAPPRRRRVWPYAVAALAVVAMVIAAAILLSHRGPAVSPEEALAHYEAGVAAWEDWELETAIEELTLAIEGDPRFAPAYYQRALAYSDDDRREEAVADLSRAIDLDPTFVAAYYERGSIYLYDLEEPERALADFDAVIELDPEYAPAYVARAGYYTWYGNDDEQAIANLERALELDPNLGEAWGMLGDLYFWREEYALSISSLERALDLEPDDSWLWEMLGMSLYAAGNYPAAVDAYDEAVRLEPGELETYYHRAFAHLAAEDVASALADFDQVLLLDQDFGGAYYGRGLLHAQARQYDEALDDFTAALEYDYWDYEHLYFTGTHPYIERALVYQALGQPQQALDDLDTLVAADDGWYLPYYYRGLLYKELGRTEDAILDFQTLWELAPDAEWQDVAVEELERLQSQPW
ncbi:MAG: tetratricopeptide repeat protein [Anaerolineae bacterium]|nr:tetratricopeptide repeat protein [Anaerolineae bacterium]